MHQQIAASVLAATAPEQVRAPPALPPTRRSSTTPRRPTRSTRESSTPR
ncbi:hypothetical protein NKG05_27200 [Oerskovia sp. M15]